MLVSDQPEIIVEGREALVPAGPIASIGADAGQPEVVATRRVEALQPFHQRVVFTWNSGTISTGNRLLTVLFAVAMVLLAIPFFLLVVGFLGVVVVGGVFAFALSWVRSKWFGGEAKPLTARRTRKDL